MHAWRHVFMACSKLEARGHLLHKTGTPPKHFSRECMYLLSISNQEKEQKKSGKNCVVPVLIIEVKLDRKAVVWAKFYGVMTI